MSLYTSNVGLHEGVERKRQQIQVVSGAILLKHEKEVVDKNKT